MSLDGDLNWSPPTEADLKVIEARRERSDKISSIMGQYLLRGYKMLSTLCPRCTTILLQKKSGELYCVACMEVDAENDKDNPAVSSVAERSQRAEARVTQSNHRQSSVCEDAITGATGRITSSLSAGSDVTHTRPDDVTRPGNRAGTVAALSVERIPALSVAVSEASAVVTHQLLTAAKQLDSCSCSESKVVLVRLVKECGDAMLSLRKLQQ